MKIIVQPKGSYLHKEFLLTVTISISFLLELMPKLSSWYTPINFPFCSVVLIIFIFTFHFVSSVFFFCWIIFSVSQTNGDLFYIAAEFGCNWQLRITEIAISILDRKSCTAVKNLNPLCCDDHTFSKSIGLRNCFVDLLRLNWFCSNGELWIWCLTYCYSSGKYTLWFNNRAWHH